MKGVNHYTKDGKLHKGSTHKMQDGTLHSGKTHSKTSKKLFHFKDLSKKAQLVAKKKQYNRPARWYLLSRNLKRLGKAVGKNQKKYGTRVGTGSVSARKPSGKK